MECPRLLGFEPHSVFLLRHRLYCMSHIVNKSIRANESIILKLDVAHELVYVHLQIVKLKNALLLIDFNEVGTLDQRR